MGQRDHRCSPGVPGAIVGLNPHLELVRSPFVGVTFIDLFFLGL